jgi:hypothetical protein
MRGIVPLFPQPLDDDRRQRVDGFAALKSAAPVRQLIDFAA